MVFNSSLLINSQISNYTNVNTSPIDVRFIYPKITVKANESFFNILNIKNNSDKLFSGTVQLTAPTDWSFVGESNIPVSIDPGDSVSIPVRVIVSSKVFGEIAYVVVASILDKSERQVKAEYCFLNVPRLPDSKVKLNNRVAYFDQKSGKASFSYSIYNNGNINEIVNIELHGPSSMMVNDNKQDNIFATSISMPPHSDSTLIFNVAVEEEDLYKQYYKLDIQTSTQDTIFKNSIWLSRIDNKYELLIPEQNKCAIIEVVLNDLFSTNKPSYSVLAMGRILFKKQTDLYYYFQNNSLGYADNFWGTNTRLYIGLDHSNFHFRAGNLESKLNQFFYGRGAEASVKLKKIRIEGFYLTGIVDTGIYYGGKMETSFLKRFRSTLGYAEIDNSEIRQFSQIQLAGLSFAFLKRNSLSVLYSQNQTTHSMYSQYTTNGNALKVIFTSKYKKIATNIDVDYGSPEYTGITKGKLFVSAYLRLNLSQSSLLSFNYYKRNYNPAIYINDVLQPKRYRYYDKYEITHQYIINPVFSINYGAAYLLESTNQLGFGENFVTQNRRIFISGKINVPETKVVVAPKFDIGKIIVDEGAVMSNPGLNACLTYNLTLNITGQYAGIYTQFRNGPYEIYDQYYYHNLGYFTKRLFVMPYYERYFFNKKLQLSIRGNLQSNFTNNTSVTTINTQLAFFLPHQFTLRLLNSLSTRTRRDALNNATLRYNSAYFQIGLRKEFDCNQPRIKYFDLKVVFYRDLNGNRVKEENEPGINNVLVNIERSFIDSIEIVRKSDFVPTELLSDYTGAIEYLNIPDGSYRMKYMILGNIVGNYSREELIHDFIIDKDQTIYIPYLENNKIFGSVILNREPLSSLGNIEIANIRIIAEDTKGNTFSALTDKQGKFVLYTPVADNYIVKINNIFYESFDLQQSEYIVKFNGYKQFEVSFVFNEKKRPIIFDNVVTDNQLIKTDELQVIKKTTLTGKIRDAISLEPVEAEIKIYDNRNNAVITNVKSNKLNGNYNISYVAGDHFRIEVKAEGYWDYVENLYIEQIISIQNIAKDIMINKLSDGPANKTFIIYDNKEEEKFKENFKPGQKIPINNLNFEEKESRLSPNAYSELDRLIEILQKNKSIKIEIAGHADDSDKERINNMIAYRRASTVARYLISHGMEEKRIEIKSYSNQRPLVPGRTENAKQKNRRVEIIVK